jgi:uncharacterized phage protein (TIGR01671 family)
MRQIKFRIWNMTGNCMHEWLELVEKNKIHLLANQQGSYPVMQFTGLTDVSGVEIYEGDIVHWGHIKGYEEYLPRKAVVEFSPDLTFSTFNLENNHKFRFGCFSYRNTNNAVEVIGNIHQNPELLK